MQQLTFDPIQPKDGTLLAAVLQLLYDRREGICRRSAVEELDCYELSARIGELEKLGWTITKRRCNLHYHQRRFVRYSLA